MSLGKKLFIGSSAGGACSADSLNPFDDGFTNSKALYQFDGDANDTTGSYNATASSGVTYTSGYIGQAATMNGSHSINTNDGGALLGDTWSISLFVKFNNANDYEYIAANWRSNPTPRISNWYLLKRNGSNSNVLEFNVYGSNGPSANYKQFIAPVSSAFTSNTWYHIAISFNGSSATDVGMYINGLPVSYTTTTNGWGGSAQVSTTLDTTLGSLSNSSSGGNYLDGQIDQVRFFNRAISDAEAAILGNETTATASDINVLNDGSGVSLYSLDYDASDAGGNYDGAATNVTFGVDGKINWGASFNGTSSRLDLPSGDLGLGTNNFAISCWFNTNSISASQAPFSIQHNGSPIRVILSLNNSTYGGNGSMVATILVGGTYYRVNTTANTFSANEWVHVAVIKSSIDGILLYVNGHLEDSEPLATANASNDVTSNGANIIGAYQTTSTSLYFNGSIDQVRIFQKSLSSSEVSTLYGETACVYTSTTDIVNYQGTNLAYYKFDNTAEDETGNYDGTESNITYEFGRYGTAAVFNGTSSYISLTDIPSTASANISISAWINADTLSGDRTIISLRKNRLIEIAINSGYSAGQRLEFKFYDGGNKVINLNENLITVGNWHHICLTAQAGGNMIAYFDGVAQGSPLAIGNVYVANQSDTIGAYYISSAGGFFDGKIDQVRIFDSALDATAVENLYNEKPEVNTSNFETVLWNGNGGSQYVSSVGLEPDFVWIKKRGNDTKDHRLFDTVRGANKVIYSSRDLAQGTVTNELTSFEANGFMLGNASAVNDADTNDSYVAWCWKAGGDAVNNTNGNITSQVSANQDAGFSIVKFTSPSSGVATIGTGLNQQAELVISKSINAVAANWPVFVNGFATNEYLLLDTGGNKYSFASDLWNLSNWSSNLIGCHRDMYGASNEVIAYCFHSVTGYQKIGSYNGSGSSGKVVTTGFKPRFLMIKNATTTSTSWILLDTARDGETQNSNGLFANLNIAEWGVNTTVDVDFTSTGFIIQNSYVLVNSLNDTFIYLAIA